jgi:hypothetical protein
LAVQRFLQATEKYFKEVDFILHAGDVGSWQVVKWLSQFAPTKAVWGNMDELSLRKMLPSQLVLEIKQIKIGLTHGWGAPEGIIQRVQEVFTEKLDCLVFGHTHQPFYQTIEETLFLNPGSPTDTRFAQVNSLGLLKINTTIKGEIVYL